MNLNQIKQEARVAFHERNLGIGYKDDKAVKAFIEETLDRLLDAVEEAVKLDYENSSFANTELKKKFEEFRGQKDV